LNNESKTTISQDITNSPGVYDKPYLADLTMPPQGYITTNVYHVEGLKSAEAVIQCGL